jgi:hypothetical protein
MRAHPPFPGDIPHPEKSGVGQPEIRSLSEIGNPQREHRRWSETYIESSNPPRSATESTIFAFSAEKSKMLRTFAQFVRLKGTGVFFLAERVQVSIGVSWLRTRGEVP